MFRIRLACIDDLETYFLWINDKHVRINSFNTKKVNFGIHRKWFLEKINSNQSCLLVLEKNNKAIGQIRFDDNETYTLIDYSITFEYRKKGFGDLLLKLGTDFYIKNRINRKIKIITAIVKQTNIASIKIFEKNGYVKYYDNDEKTIIFKKEI